MSNIILQFSFMRNQNEWGKMSMEFMHPFSSCSYLHSPSQDVDVLKHASSGSELRPKVDHNKQPNLWMGRRSREDG